MKALLARIEALDPQKFNPEQLHRTVCAMLRREIRRRAEASARGGAKRKGAHVDRKAARHAAMVRHHGPNYLEILRVKKLAFPPAE